MKNVRLTSALILGGITVLCSSFAVADGWTPIVGPNDISYKTKAPLTGSITNTRHNLTQSFLGDASLMASAGGGVRNNYGEICVYCHTPHGANTTIKAPIWNRTIIPKEYKIYDKLRTLNRPIGQPGANSLTCLSCHDGTTAIDSIINMPGSGRFNANQQTVVDKGWLSDNWFNGTDASGNKLTVIHAEMGNEIPSDLSKAPVQTDKCAFCHNSDTAGGPPDFRVFVIGTDLRNDHPIGILFPDTFGPGIDFNQPTGTVIGKMKYFDINGNSHPDTNEPRLYDTGEGPEVECASCHDPHGIPMNNANRSDGVTRFIPSFLRVSNGQAVTAANPLGAADSGRSSGLCLTCHDK